MFWKKRWAHSQYDRMAFDDGDLMLEWDAHLRLLDALDPTYRD